MRNGEKLNDKSETNSIHHDSSTQHNNSKNVDVSEARYNINRILDFD